MAKRILLIGDLRSVQNYGAIATTESLIEMLGACYPLAELRCIGFQSMQTATPIDGWGTGDYAKKHSSASVFSRLLTKVKTILFGILPHAIILSYIKKKEQKSIANTIPNPSYHIPVLYKHYAAWAEKVSKGEALQYEKRMLEWSDAVLINGEGNIVQGIDAYGVYRHRALYILYMAWLAKYCYKKPTYIVNHVIDPACLDAIDIIKKVYPLLDQVVVRDPISLEKLSAYGIKGATYAPDALFSYTPENVQWQPTDELKSQIDFSKPYILLGDSSSFKNNYSHVQWDIPIYMKALIRQLQQVIPQVVFVDGYNGMNSDINIIIHETGIGRVSLINCTWRDLYQVMKRAKIFISGRWHASILSILAGTPILCWGADSHKTRALYTIMDYPYKFFETATLPIHIDELVDETRKILQNRVKIQESYSNKISLLRKASYGNVACVETK